MSKPDLSVPVRLMQAGCACGVAASVLLPWYTVSCVAYAVAAVVFGAGCLKARTARGEFGLAVRLAAATAVIFALNIPLQDTAAHMLMALAGAVAFYFCVTYAVTGLERAAGRAPSGSRRPPRIVMLFEYCAGIYALAFLAADAFPAVAGLAQWVAMAAFAVGFALVIQYLLAYAKQS